MLFFEVVAGLVMFVVMGFVVTKIKTDAYKAFWASVVAILFHFVLSTWGR